MKGIAYYRVSTAAQGRSGLGLAAQMAAVRDLADARVIDVLAEFTEVESGKRNDRPQLAIALQQAKLTGGILVIAKLDRLSRNAAFLLALRDSGVRFLAADIPDANDLTIGVLAVIAQAEREMISRRTKEALAAVKSKLESGQLHVSRTGAPVGRLGNPNGTAAIRRRGNASAVQAVKRIAEQRAIELKETIEKIKGEGHQSFVAMAAALNHRGIVTARGGRWYPATVSNLISRIGST